MYFDKMTHDGLLILESHFVSRMSSADYIMKEKERYNKNQEHFSSFTRAKSAALTERSMRASKMNLNPPKILKHYETNKTSTYKRNKSEEDVVE